MPDHPIIFSALMVRALLDGRKTQTRRLAWRNELKGEQRCGYVPGPSIWRRVQPGDRLWVREAWQPEPEAVGGALYRASHADEEGPWRPSIHMPRWASRLTLHVEAVRVERLQAISEEDAISEGIFWSVTSQGWTSGHPDDTACFHLSRPEESFRKLWNTLHGPGAWKANPEVVVLQFRVDRRNIDA